MEFDPDTQQINSITFSHGKVYVMERDTFFLAPYIYPDNAASKSIAWESEDEDIVHCSHDTIIAEKIGVTRLIVTTVLNQKSDTCIVHVIPRWEVDSYTYPYDMLLFAHVTMDGLPLPSHVRLAAFWEDTPRGLAFPVDREKSIYCFRIWSYFDNSNDSITFQAYDSRNLQRYFIDYSLKFDGQTHGIPSDPINLKFNTK